MDRLLHSYYMKSPDWPLIAEGLDAARKLDWRGVRVAARRLQKRRRPPEEGSDFDYNPVSIYCIELLENGMLAACAIAGSEGGCVFRLTGPEGFVVHASRQGDASVAISMLTACAGPLHRHRRELVFWAANQALYTQRYEFVRYLHAMRLLGTPEMGKLIENLKVGFNPEIARVGARELGVEWQDG